jgi:glycosyltransferase involved in cell wall biosynthesis
MPDKDSWGGPTASEPPFVEALKQFGVEAFTETYVYGDKEISTSIIRRVIRVIKTALRLRRRLAADQFDVVHLNTAFDKKTVVRDAVSIFLMRPGRAKVFLKIHGAAAHLIASGSPAYAPVIKYLDKRVAGYGVFTEDETKSLMAHGLDERKFHRIKNIIVLDDECEEKRRSNQPATIHLLFVSRFIPTKGLLETITALSLLHGEGFDFHLYCLGDGPIRQDAEHLTKELHLNEMVTFTGYIPESEVAKYFSTSDIFVFPTQHAEGFPIALLKAVAAGMPIVTTKVRAAAEYLSEPENCFFSSNDPADIARRIRELVLSEEIRIRMSAENVKLGQRFNAEAVTAEYVEIYRKLLAERTVGT